MGVSGQFAKGKGQQNQAYHLLLHVKSDASVFTGHEQFLSALKLNKRGAIPRLAEDLQLEVVGEGLLTATFLLGEHVNLVETKNSRV